MDLIFTYCFWMCLSYYLLCSDILVLHLLEIDAFCHVVFIFLFLIILYVSICSVCLVLCFVHIVGISFLCIYIGWFVCHLVSEVLCQYLCCLYMPCSPCHYLSVFIFVFVGSACVVIVTMFCDCTMHPESDVFFLDSYCRPCGFFKCVLFQSVIVLNYLSLSYF